MRKYYALLFLLVLTGVKAQVTTTGAYTLGDLGTEFNFSPTTSSPTSCVDTLVINIPAGNWVVAVDVSYSMTASGFAWMQEQRSFLTCPTTNTTEPAVYSGVGNSAGTMLYNRTGLTFANGPVASGQLKFVIKSFRTFGTGGGTCSTLDNRLNNNWTVTVHHAPPPTCFQPTSLIALGTTGTSANLSWTSGGATNWQIEYGPAGFTPGSGTLVNVSTNPATLTGLSPSTSYTAYVRDSCGLGDVSWWSLGTNFLTTCLPVPAPFTENFNGPDWVSGSGTVTAFNSNDAVSLCWPRTPGGNTGFANAQHFWGARSGTTPSGGFGQTGPSSGRGGTGKYIYTETQSATPADAFISSPSIDLTPLTIPELRFWYHMYGPNTNGIGTLTVEVNNGSGWTTVFTRTGNQQTSQADAWKEAIIPLPSFAGDTVQVRFKGTRVGFQGDIAIDDFSIQEAPTCPQPNNLTAFFIGSHSASVSWTPGIASNWNIAYGAPGFSPLSGTIVNATATSLTLTGLTPSTTYDIYVRDSCGLGDASVWIGPLQITTLCAPFLAPYTAAFSGTNFVPGTGVYNGGDLVAGCWNRSPGGNAGTFATAKFFWSAMSGSTNTFNTGPTVDHTSGNTTGKYLYTESTPGANGDTAYLYSPLVSTVGLTVPELRFWYHMAGPSMGNLYVEINDGSGWVGLTSLLGVQQTATTDPWLESVISLNGYANDTIQIRFKGTKGGPQSDMAIDDFSIAEAPPCPQPVNLSIVSFGSSSATLSWTTGGSSLWQISYGAPGFTPATGTIVPATSNPFTITGLTPSTAYSFYVRDSCGASGNSVWVGPVTLTTNCLPVLAPWTENFDGTDFTNGGTFGAAGTLNTCWSRGNTAGYFWKPGPEVFPFNNSGPSGDHTTGTGKYMFTMSFGIVSAPVSTNLRTPLIDLSNLTNPQLVFFVYMYGSAIGSLEVQVDSGNGFNTEFTLTGQQQTNNSSPWVEVIVPLSAYAGDTIQIRFRGSKTSTSTLARIAIDDVSVIQAPTCPHPNNVQLVAVTATTAVIDWTTGGASVWQVEYGPPGYTPGTGTVVTATAHPFTITGLTPNTSYDFYVRDSCGVGDVSTWWGGASGTTSCVPVAAPYSEDFEAPDFGPQTAFGQPATFSNCWSRSAPSNYDWWVGPSTFSSSFNSGPDADHTPGTGTQFVYMDMQVFSASGGSQSLSSPLIDLSPLDTAELSFWYHFYGTDIGTFNLQINNGGSTWTTLWTLSGQQQTSGSAPWNEVLIDLSAYADDTIQLRFTGSVTSFAFLAEAAFDDISIYEKPDCPKPMALSVTSTTTTSATLSWTTGGATAWQVEYGPSGFTPGTGTLVNATTNPFVVTGLTPSTTYEFVVRDSCAAGSVSLWSQPASGTTQCATVPAPWFENFDGADFLSGSTFAGPGTVQACWTRSTTTGYFWRPGPGINAGFNTGPSADHTSGAGKYLYMESSGAVTTPATGSITTPQIDLTPLTTPELSFYYHMYGNTIGSLGVEINAGSGWVSLWSLSGQQQTSSTAPWTEAIVSLASYANQTVQLRFNGTKNSFGFQARSAIDDVRIDEAPSCPKPTLLSIVSETDSSVTLSWTSGGATSWQVEYGPQGFTPGTGTIVTISSNPGVVFGLSAATTYTFYVRDSCGLGDVSDWSDPVTGPTDPCSGACIYTLDLTDTFGDGWNNAAITVSVGGAVTTYTLASGNSITYTIQVCDSLPIVINVTALGSFPMEVGFVLKDPNNAIVYQLVASPTLTIGQKYSGLGTCPGCNDPTALTSSALTFNSVSIGWTTGGGTPGQIQYGAAGFTLGSGNVAPALGNPAPQGGLAPNTTYDFYVRESCSGNFTNWVGPITITTQPCPAVVPTFTYTLSGYTLSVNGSATTGASVYGWYWGDGSPISGGTTATHTYTGDGIYTVMLVASNTCNGIDTFQVSIPICAPVASGFSYSATNLAVTFTNTSTGNITDHYWDFGDLSTSSSTSPSHTYAVGGTYTVTYTAVNLCGDSSTTTQTITVCLPPTATIAYTSAGTVLTFNSAGSTGSTFTWNFGTGDTDTGAVVSYDFVLPGTFLVTLTVSNDCGATATATVNITVCAKPVASWTYTIISTTGSGMLVQFDATASTNAVNYFWNFGDGNTLTGSAFPTHTYATPGLFYEVTLIAYNSCGGSDTLKFKLNQISVEEELVASTRIYPNPSTGSFVLEQGRFANETIQLVVFNAQGVEVVALSAEPNQQGQMPIDLRHLPAGVYTLRITNGTYLITKQVVLRE